MLAASKSLWALAVLFVLNIETPARSIAAKPNVLLIVSEDNGPEIGCYGDRYADTPNLDRLADEGIRFDRAYVPQAGCSQSRASFLTGLYPHQHGQIGLATWGFRLYRDDTPNLASLLKSEGYRTGLIGKLHVNPASAFPFDEHNIPSANFQRKSLGDYAKFARDFIHGGEEPFFLSVNYPDPHDPWLAQVEGLPKNPKRASDVEIMEYMGIESHEFKQMVADYYNCISRMDSLVGDLLEVLERSGQAKNTLVIYIGDHGADMLRGKRTCYEGGLRIPMILRFPEVIEPQVRSDLVSTLDLVPTILELADATAPEGLAGESLEPFFHPGEVEWRTHFFAEYHTHAAAPNFFPQRSVRNKSFKLIESLLPNTVHPDYAKTISKLHGDFTDQDYAGDLDLNAVIGETTPVVQAAYALMRQPPRYQLYDLRSDPYEFRNLAEDKRFQDVLEDLKGRLNAWRQESNDPLLDEAKLKRLTKEVQSRKTKSSARKHQWEYPNYLVK